MKKTKIENRNYKYFKHQAAQIKTELIFKKETDFKYIFLLKRKIKENPRLNLGFFPLQRCRKDYNQNWMKKQIMFQSKRRKDEEGDSFSFFLLKKEIKR